MSSRAKASRSTPDDHAAISAQIAAWRLLGKEALQAVWRKELGGDPPSHLSRWLLFRVLAYRLQAAAFGDLDRETVAFLNRVADAVEARRAGRSDENLAVPRRLKAGAVLVREYERVMHRVAVTETGYSWSGNTYRSLSQVAYAITGTRWNGPRFFGLREKKKCSTPTGETRQSSQAAS